MIEINTEYLKRIKAEKGLNTPDISRMAGISKDTIRNIERGKGTTEKTIKKIADALEVSVHTLIKDGGEEVELQKGRESADKSEVAEKRDTYNKDTEESGVKISSLLTRAAEILDSNSIFRQVLAANINAFHLAIHSEEKILSLQGRIDYLEGQNKSLESRLAAVEEKLKGG